MEEKFWWRVHGRMSSYMWRLLHALNDDPEKDNKWCERCRRKHYEGSISTWAS